jgi:opacity protein-like surface antigen
MKLISSVVALTLVAASSIASAQDATPRQYLNLSAFKWEASNGSKTVEAEFDGVDSVTGSIVDSTGTVEAQGFRLLTGYRLYDWLGIELHVGTGGDAGFNIRQTTTDFTVVFPEGFDFTQITSVNDVNLSDFELDTTTTESQLPAKAELNQIWGFFLRPAWVPNKTFSLYGLLGYSYAKVDYQTEPSWYTVTERGVSYGVGAEVTIFPGVLGGGLNGSVDYIRYLDGSELELDALSFGLGLRF